MRRIILVLICGLILQQTQAQIPDDTNGWLYRLCKTWGYVKYFNQNKCEVAWDELLNTAVSDVLAAAENDGYNRALLKFLTNAGNNTAVSNPPALPDTNLLVDTEWLNDPLFSPEVRGFLETFSSHVYPDRSNCFVRTTVVTSPSGYSLIDFSQDTICLPIDYNKESHRLTVMFYYWNLINYFFPYRNLMDIPWDATLHDFIPVFRGAIGEPEFHKNFLKLVTRINDSHGATGSKVLSASFWEGAYWPMVRFERIEGKCVVTKVGSEVGISPGDILTGLDGFSIREIEDSLANFTPASTEAALYRDIYNHMLRGALNSSITMALVDESGNHYSKTLNRSESATDWYNWFREPGFPLSYFKTACGYGYVNMKNLQPEEVSYMYSAFKSVPVIIFDLRNYPNGTLGDLARLLFPSEFKNVIFYFPALVSEFRHTEYNYYPGWYYKEDDASLLGTWSNPNPYSGRMYILVNHETQSAAEYTCQSLSYHKDSKVIGTQTAGADGNVSYIRLPGGIITYFTSLGTYYADGYQQQRNGVKIDKVVEPTIQGIRDGVDEILMAALDCLSGTSIPTVGKSQISVFPNPAITGSVKVCLSLDRDSEITLSVMDLTGKIMVQEVQYCPAGDQTLELDLNAIAPGLYILETRSRLNTAITKLVIR